MLQLWLQSWQRADHDLSAYLADPSGGMAEDGPPVCAALDSRLYHLVPADEGNDHGPTGNSTGLGLPLSRALAKACGGWLGLTDSVHLGRTVMALPAGYEAPAAPPTPAIPKHGGFQSMLTASGAGSFRVEGHLGSRMSSKGSGYLHERNQPSSHPSVPPIALLPMLRPTNMTWYWCVMEAPPTPALQLLTSAWSPSSGSGGVVSPASDAALLSPSARPQPNRAADSSTCAMRN